MNDPKRTIANRMIEQNLELYKGFYDHDWARGLFDNLPPQLAEAVDNLCLAWKEASNTHRLPWLMVDQMKHFAGGLIRGHKPRLTRLFEAVRNKIRSDLDGWMKRVDKKKFLGYFATFDQALRIADQEHDIEFPVQKYWEQMVDESEFHMSISGSQNLAYCALVFAYEWFLVNCFRALGGDDASRPNYKAFWDDFKTRLGGDPKATYWEHKPVKVAREARNCIAHLGGKAKPELIALDPNLWISPEGIISVRASDNHGLFQVLQSKVSMLIGETKRKLTP